MPQLITGYNFHSQIYYTCLFD